MTIGFTGTQNGMTNEQKDSFRVTLMDSDENVFVHGGCVGADEEAHYIALMQGYSVDVYPGVNRKGEADKRGTFEGAHLVFPEKFYLDRNEDIVDRCNLLIACPDGPERLRSGTWSTVRYARDHRTPVVIIHPDGGRTFEDNASSNL